MKKKILALSLALGVFALILSAGTLAYFTDSKSITNTFTVGNVKIDLIESQYHRVNAGQGNATGKTEPAVGGYLWAADVDLQGTADNTPDKANSAWSGTYFSDDQIKADAATYKAEGGYYETHANNMAPGSNVRKNPYVINTGKNDAYVRVRVLVPKTLFSVIDNGSTYWTSTALTDGVTSKAVKIYNESGYEAVPTVTRNNIEYYEYDFTYTNALKPGAMTFWNVWGNVAIDKNATSEQLANVDSFDVIFEADAIQADGFNSAEEAFANF
jgi:predicted ribosomally synthesized peptide with SipW-like signal peptide